ncbi:Sugar kinase of the NBD/HSP70 family, may contain an N-terminal HTH domain [Amphibacillus marinus]|uniref:Sugar kinase of the NBD/HSP70 family, may contain an N-terminal HTH domain n=1 Tax=Amphibacillus marinus TaxID=872970 RepID=A0A1H8N8T6_9BACI|nr:ROK family protein [Amphibacillus marinus]SEO26101.1 Sugar kinase of the NBD/HSP70 family, may contain an N-terminal HTH domain [Amphibacillus marinus]
MRHVLAFDIGGTFIKRAIVSEGGEIKHLEKVTTPTALAELYSVIQATTSQIDSEIIGIALSAPGAVQDNGVIAGVSALPYIHGPNIKKDIANLTGLPVALENDANCAALAEGWVGQATDVQDFVTFVIGTGIGGAIVKAGQIHKGAHGQGGEWGQMIVNEDGKLQAYSRVASTAALVRQVRKAHDLGALTGEAVFQLAEEGDSAALEAIERFYANLAMGICNIQSAYDPELVLIGGGISTRSGLVEQINQAIRKLVDQIDELTVYPEIRLCQFQADANLIGAANHFFKVCS